MKLEDFMSNRLYGMVNNLPTQHYGRHTYYRACGALRQPCAVGRGAFLRLRSPPGVAGTSGFQSAHKVDARGRGAELPVPAACLQIRNSVAAGHEPALARAFGVLFAWTAGLGLPPFPSLRLLTRGAAQAPVRRRGDRDRDLSVWSQVVAWCP